MKFSYQAEAERCAVRMRSSYTMRQYYPDRAMFHQNETIQYFHHRNLDYVVQRKTRLKQIQTAEQAQAYCQEVRAKIHELIGDMPTEKPTGAKVVSSFSMPGYTVDNVLIESLPGYWITANFYKPEGLEEKAPAILFLCGHTKNGKAGDGYEAFCAEAVTNGFCVLTFDPVGQGERFMLDEKDAVHIEGHDPDSVHCHLGHQLFLMGESLNKYMMWDNIRALDYLLSRPEVDTGRIAVSGNSGGGQTSAFMGAYDDRIHVVAPSCYITELAELAYNCGIQEIEQDVYGLMKAGLDISDLMNAAAPRPYCVSGGLYDFFPVEGLRDATVETHRLYTMMGLQDKYEVFIGPRPHGFFTDNRKFVLNFICKHLMNGKKAVFPEDGIEIPEEKQLYCAGGDVRTLNTTTLLDYCRTKAAGDKCTDAPLEQRVRQTLGMRADYTPTGTVCVPADGQKDEFSFESEPYMRIYATLNRAGAADGLAVQVGEGGFDAQGPVLKVEPRGTGRATVQLGSFYFSEDNYYMNDESTYTWNAVLLGQSMLGMRSGDAISGIELAHTLSDGPIHLYGEGRYALYALIAALYADVSKVTLKGLLTSFADIVAQKDYDLSVADMGFGVLKSFDIDEIIEAVRARGIEVELIGRRDAMGNPV
nr:acetylxylan esterase [bacterium]